MIELPEDDAPEAPDLTAVLDLLFILLVFFLLTAGSVERALEVDLPRTDPEAAEPVTRDEPLRVTIAADGWRVGEQRLPDWAAAKAALASAVAERPERRLLIQGERSAPMERLVRLLGFLQAQGLSAAQIQVRGEALQEERG